MLVFKRKRQRKRKWFVVGVNKVWGNGGGRRKEGGLYKRRSIGRDERILVE
jgi:hypothetical protein